MSTLVLMNAAAPLLPAPAYGSKFDRALGRTEICARIRRDIANAIADGLLPKGTKVSVRGRVATHTDAIDVVVTAYPGVVMSTKRVRADIEHPHVTPWLPYLGAEGRRVLALLEAIVGAYNRGSFDGMTDSSTLRFFANVGFASELRAAQRDEIEAAILGARAAA